MYRLASCGSLGLGCDKLFMLPGRFIVLGSGVSVLEGDRDVLYISGF